MPRISERAFIIRAQAIHAYRQEHPRANAHQVAKGVGLSYSWVRNFLVQSLYGHQSRAHQTHPKRRRSYEDSPALNHLLASLRSNPPATQSEAWERLNEFGVVCTPSMTPRYLRKWGLPVPAPTRGVNAGKHSNKPLERLKSELRVLCMQHPDGVPVDLIKELIDAKS